MRRITHPIGLAAFLGIAGLSSSAGAATVGVGTEPPDFAGTWLNHDQTTLKDLRGRAVLIEFWATW